ncbi:MAG: FtsQ-type POTRA domain-containing protein [Deltaproteobacteria bacterium]|nr:FtsQ-type POTRA domain-containing protein [Deltaproteobacteria bacterium]
MNGVLEQQIVRKKTRWVYFLWQQCKKYTGWFRQGTLLLIIGLGIYFGITKSNYFSVQKIEVVGDFRYINRDQVVAKSGLKPGMNLFEVSLNRVRENLEQLPWVKEVLIRRQLPSSVWIHLKEEEPRALLLKKNLTFISSEGKLIAPFQGLQNADWPVFTGFDSQQKIRGGVELLNFFQKKQEFQLFRVAEIHYNGATGFSVVTNDRPMEIHLGEDQIEKKLERLQALWPKVSKRWSNIRGIDLDYEDKVVLKI